jgi:hypothetical protein
MASLQASLFLKKGGRLKKEVNYICSILTIFGICPQHFVRLYNITVHSDIVGISTPSLYEEG